MSRAAACSSADIPRRHAWGASAAGGLIVLLWFAGGAVAAVWLVFRDPTFDLRLLVVGALLPDVVDGPLGGARVAHSVVTAVAVLAVTMVATVGRRARRKRLLAVPIGVFLHLVLDGAFTDPRVFWWPLSGLALPDARLPSLARGWWNVPLEIVGGVLLVRLWPRRRASRSDTARSVGTC